MIRIKFGGSGDTTSEKLETAQDLIIRSRTLKCKLSIDSNFVMNLINEVQESRKNKRIIVEEFHPNYSESFDVLSSEDYSDTIEVDDADIEEIDDADNIEIKTPIAPKKRKSACKTSSSSYWLNSRSSRFFVGMVLVILITLMGLCAIII